MVDVEADPAWVWALDATREAALRAWRIFCGEDVDARDDSFAFAAATRHVAKLMQYGTRPRRRDVREAWVRRCFLVEYVLVAERRADFV